MKIRYALPALVAAAALALTGCTNTENTEAPKTSGALDSIEADAAAVALLPERVKEAGVLNIATDADTPFVEFKDADGKPTGWGFELASAVALKLGLEPKWTIMGFDSIIPNVQEEQIDMGSSAMTDTAERQKSVDFVDYFEAGILWASEKGNDVDPENACGLSVGVQDGTYQHTDELPARSQKCVDEGKKPIDIQPYETNSEAINAVILGKVDAVSADSPVILGSVKQTDDKLQSTGAAFDLAPFGYVIKRDSDLTAAVQAALQSLMDDGNYEKILAASGVADGGLSKATINAGK